MLTPLRIHVPLPRPRPRSALATVAVVLVIGGLLALLRPIPAHGLAAGGHGVGHLWKGDNASWIGTYRMADGRLGFCLEAGRPSPVGNQYSTTETSLVAGTTPEETARLAWIARTFAGSQSQDEAAAAQLAVWTITGLAGHTQAHYAARANDRAAAVLQRANAILAESNTKSSMSVTGRMTLSVDDRGVGSIAADILTTAPGGASTVVPIGQFSGTATLLNATLPGGATSGSVANGNPIPLTVDTSKPEIRVRADVAFRRLPFGRSVVIGTSPSGSQGLLFAGGGTVSALASATANAVSPRPFQPRVETQTSSTQVSPGAEVTDQIDVSVAEGPGLLAEWGRYRSGDSLELIPVTVKSRLLGPFPGPIDPTDEWPADPPTVCTVSTVISNGPGTATTPPCRVPSAGYYVWVETIDPADTPAEKGRDRLRAWKSPFGTASEVTFSPAGIAVHTRVADDEVEAGSCAVDELSVSGTPTSADTPEVDVESLLLGPFDQPVADGEDLSDLDEYPLAGTATTTVTADGTYETPCIRVTDPGHYVFVFRSDGSAPGPDGHQLVPAFSDLTAHQPEMLRVLEPERPTPPPTTPPVTVPPTTPAVTPPAPTPTKSLPPVLAFTGSSGTTGLVALGATGIGVGALALGARALLKRRRHAAADRVESGSAE